MKHSILVLLLAAGLAVLCACGAEKEPVQPESGGEAMDIENFSFSHTGSSTDQCFYFALTREEDGVRFYGEELFSGGRIADAVVENSAIDRLGKLAGSCHLERWDGFDKNDKHVMDGSTFTLDITLENGSTISAHGNNRFPEQYSEVFSEIRALYDELMQQYGS